MSQPAPSDVVVAGGGIAALELILALRELAGDRLRVTVITPDPDFVLRPRLVAAPLGAATAFRRPWDAIAAELGVELRHAAVAAVEPEHHRVILRSGDSVAYGTLVIAPGARHVPAYDDAIQIGDAAGLRTLRAEIARGDVDSVAFVAPSATGWLLPLYEAALITANGGLATAVSLVTPEARPLELFGPRASADVARALRDAGVEFLGGRHPRVERGRVHAERLLTPDRIVSLPLVRGPQIDGVPATGLFGLVPIDEYGRVAGVSDIYAIGDATDFPVKQGGIACQQAGTVARHIVEGAGAAPFRAQLRATLLTGAGAPLLLNGGQGPEKLPGPHLAAFVAGTPEPA